MLTRGCAPGMHALSLFGFLIVATELKTWPIIGAFQKRVDKYFHLLSVAKGKGGFYCFIGFLAFIASEWSLARVCTLLVCIVGVFHLLGYPRQPDQQQGLAASDDAQHQTDGMEASAMSGVTEFAMKVSGPRPLRAHGRRPTCRADLRRGLWVELDPRAPRAEAHGLQCRQCPRIELKPEVSTGSPDSPPPCCACPRASSL